MALEDDFVAETLRQWWPEVKEKLEKAILSRKLVLTDTLYRSLEAEVKNGTGEVVTQLVASFSEYGRNLDMKSATYRKRPPVDVMEDYVRKRGLASFKKIPGTGEGRKMPTEDIQVRRLAWALASSKLSKGTVLSNKKWYSRNFNAMVYVLIDRLTNNYAEFAAQQVTQNFKSDVS